MKKIIITLLCTLAPLCHAGDDVATKAGEVQNYEEIAKRRKFKIQELKRQSYWNIGFAFSLGSCLRFNRLVVIPAAIISGIGSFKPSLLNNAKLMLFNDGRVAQIAGNMYQVFQHKLDNLVKKSDELAKQKPNIQKESNTSNKTE